MQMTVKHRGEALAKPTIDLTKKAGGGLIDAAAGVAVLATVFAAVYHAEVVARRVGEPFGTLILAPGRNGD